MSPRLSIIVPAYNEEARIGATLVRMGSFIEEQGLDAEILVVDDGSRDQTCAVVRNEGARNPRIRLIAQSKNQGKGAAVKAGMLEASG